MLVRNNELQGIATISTKGLEIVQKTPRVYLHIFI